MTVGLRRRLRAGAGAGLAAWGALAPALLAADTPAPVASALPARARRAETDAFVGVNLAPVVDWSRAWPFTDAFRSARAWSETAGPVSYDDAGWPRALAPGQAVSTLLLREVEGHYPPGRYVLTYAGRGHIGIRGFDAVRTVKDAPGRIEYDVTPGNGGLRVVIDATDPDAPVRDVHLWMPDAARVGGLFHPVFLASLAPFRVLRFMDWQRTNGSELRSWQERARIEDARWSSPKGVPIEVMVDLANRKRASTWFCMPHQADDDFVRRFAETVRARLHPSLRVYVEYSNEVWNGSFSQAAYARSEGLRRGLATDPAIAGRRFYAERSIEVFRIWEAVFGGASRLVRVLAGQFVYPAAGEEILAWHGAAAHADAYAVAPYFGAVRGPLRTAADAGDVDGVLAALAEEVTGANHEHARNAAALARRYGIPLIAYEGGQHLVGTDDAMVRTFTLANQHPTMGAIYTTHLASWRSAGGGAYLLYSHVDRPSKWGAWGLLESQDQPASSAPKYAAVARLGGAFPPR